MALITGSVEKGRSSMNKWRFLFSLFPITLLATVNEPPRFELLTGYRNDQLHWHLQEPGDGSEVVYTEKYTGLQFWENELAFKVIHRDLVFSVWGGYAAFGRGPLKERYGQLPYTSEAPSLSFDASGWALDGLGHLGYAVNLTPDRTYKVILIPLFGFSGHYETLNRTGNDLWESGNVSLTSSFQQRLDQTWYGIYLGGGFRIEPGGRLSFEVGYAYHWLHLKFSTGWTPNAIVGSTEIRAPSSLSLSSGGNLGQSGWLSLACKLNEAWSLGVSGQIEYYASRVLSTSVKENSISLPRKFKLRWTSIAGLFTLSREI
jgi:hypothetical protein